MTTPLTPPTPLTLATPTHPFTVVIATATADLEGLEGIRESLKACIVAHGRDAFVTSYPALFRAVPEALQVTENIPESADVRGLFAWTDTHVLYAQVGGVAGPHGDEILATICGEWKRPRIAETPDPITAPSSWLEIIPDVRLNIGDRVVNYSDPSVTGSIFDGPGGGLYVAEDGGITTAPAVAAAWRLDLEHPLGFARGLLIAVEHGADLVGLPVSAWLRDESALDNSVCDVLASILVMMEAG